MHDSVKILRKI